VGRRAGKSDAGRLHRSCAVSLNKTAVTGRVTAVDASTRTLG